jgi:DNA-binding IclR family transcriptional regulator
VAAVVQTLDRGLEALALLADEPDGLTVAELADRLAVDRAVVYRLTATLQARRLVLRDDDGRLRLGVGLVELARGVAPHLRAVALPELRRLAEDLVATATLTVADGDEAVALAVVEPPSSDIHVAYRPGLRHPLTRGASGKAILAGRPFRREEPNDVTRARRRGFAVSEGELEPGAVGIAAPIEIAGWADASVGAVALARFPREAGHVVADAAERIAERIAGPSDLERVTA